MLHSKKDVFLELACLNAGVTKWIKREKELSHFSHKHVQTVQAASF